MHVSNETKTLLEKINDHSGKPLKNNFEVSVIIEFALKSKDKGRFNDLIFKAKYIKGLKNVLSNRIVIGDDFMEKIFNEFNKNLQEFMGLLKEVVNSEDEKTNKYFNQKYFELKHESVVNSMELIEDLAACKEFFNSSPDNSIN